MKLGTQTGSLINHIYSTETSGIPVAGTGATMLGWSDRKPGTVFKVFSVGKSTIVEVRCDRYTRTDKNGMSESQEYEYKTDINGCRRFFRQTKNGGWEGVYKSSETGRWVKSGGNGVIFGRRERYHDFTF